MTLLSTFKKFLRLKRIFINFSTRSLANLFSKLLGLITLPIITRALGPEAFGNYNLALVIAQYTALPMGLLGLRSYGIREIAAGRKSTHYAMEILSMQFTMALISVSISFLIAYFIFKSNLLLLIAIILGYFIVFASAFDLEFFFVSQKDLAFPTIAKIIGQLFYVIGVVLFIKKPTDFVVLVFLASLSPIIGDLIQLRRYFKNHSTFRLGMNLSELWATFKKTWMLGISQNLEGFLGSIPQLLLPIMIGAYALGIYAGGMKVYSILVMFYVTFFYALAPYLVQLNKKPIDTQRKYHFFIFLLLLLISSAIGIFLYMFGEPLIVLLLGKSFGESGLVFKSIAITLIPLTPIIMLLGNILIYSGYEKYYLTGLIIDGITIMVTAPFFIKKFAVVGAVYSMALSMFITIVVLAYYYFKMTNKILMRKIYAD